MSERCRHRRVFARIWTSGAWIKLLGDTPVACARVCNDCREWLSLGPSTETGEHAAAVAIEILAAQHAYQYSPESLVDADDFEMPLCCGPALCDCCDLWRLAATIATHDEGDRE